MVLLMETLILNGITFFLCVCVCGDNGVDIMVLL